MEVKQWIHIINILLICKSESIFICNVVFLSVTKYPSNQVQPRSPSAIALFSVTQTTDTTYACTHMQGLLVGIMATYPGTSQTWVPGYLLTMMQRTGEVISHTKQILMKFISISQVEQRFLSMLYQHDTLCSQFPAPTTHTISTATIPQARMNRKHHIAKESCAPTQCYQITIALPTVNPCPLSQQKHCIPLDPCWVENTHRYRHKDEVINTHKTRPDHLYQHK